MLFKLIVLVILGLTLLFLGFHLGKKEVKIWIIGIFSFLGTALKKCAVYSSIAEYDVVQNAYHFGNTLYIEFWVS